MPVQRAERRSKRSVHTDSAGTGACAVRDMGCESAISDVTGLSIGTIKRKLRDAHGITKLRNLFEQQWPYREDELGIWTAAYARERDASDEIAGLIGLSVAGVIRRLEEAAGNTLVQNVFGIEWGAQDASGTASTRPMRDDEDSVRRPRLSVPAGASLIPEADDFVAVGERSPMFRNRRARAIRCQSRGIALV